MVGSCVYNDLSIGKNKMAAEIPSTSVQMLGHIRRAPSSYPVASTNVGFELDVPCAEGAGKLLRFTMVKGDRCMDGCQFPVEMK